MGRLYSMSPAGHASMMRKFAADKRNPTIEARWSRAGKIAGRAAKGHGWKVNGGRVIH